MDQRWSGTCREYDAEGHLVATFRFVEIVYDDLGRIKEEQYFTKEAKPDYRYVYEYDDAGVLSEKKMFLGRDYYYKQLLFQYSAGKVHAITWMNRDGKTEARETFEYSDNGKKAVSVRENIGQWIHEFDEQGREIQVSGFTYSDAIMTETEYEYDGTGHLLRMERSHLNRCVVTLTQDEP